ncbi:MAG: response regulator [Lachnospiraceae bacterium]|nr:response regulator [Lachnospiraceae bacterium]
MSKWIIVVDDDVTNLKIAGQILSKNGMRVTAVRSGQALIDYVSQKGVPDLILLDINMPGMDGFETYEKFRKLEEDMSAAATPVVMLTADEDISTESRGLAAGVSDYIRKPFDPDVLVRRVDNILDTQVRMRRFEEEATIDKLTGFLNKYSSNEQIAGLCRSRKGTLMIIDLDSFKLVNDIYGHDMGDRVLKTFAGILRENMHFPATFGRIGGDEFLIFAENLKEEKEIAKYSEIINRDLLTEARRMMGEDMSIPLGASLGAAFVPEQGTDFNVLFRLCDRALYTIKNNGKHGYSLYLEDDEAADAIPTDINLAMLTTILEERSIPQNAMWMGKEAFGNVYRYMIRYMDRYHGTAYKMLFSAKFTHTGLSVSEKEKIMVSLRELLQESLRNSDIMMQIGDSHFFLMLPEINDYNVSRVTDRVMNAWSENEYSRFVRLEVETESTDRELHDLYSDSKSENRVAVLTEDDSERELMVSALTEKGFSVDAMSGGGELLAYLEEHRPGLMIIKAVMEGMSGIDTVINIRKQGGALKRIPIIFISDGDDAVEKRGLELGAADFVETPISPEKLCLRAENIYKLNLLKNRVYEETEKNN